MLFRSIDRGGEEALNMAFRSISTGARRFFMGRRFFMRCCGKEALNIALQSISTGAKHFLRGHGGEEALNRAALQSTSLLTPRFRGVAKEAAKESGETADLGATGSVAGGESSPVALHFGP